MKNYFEKLFNSLSEIDEETGERCIWVDCETLDSPEDLKKYMVNILASNMQYDFHIDFDEKDVEEFAEALSPRTSLCQLQCDGASHTLREYINTGLNAVVFENHTYWVYDGLYCSDDDDNVNEETLNTEVEYDFIDTDCDGDPVIYVRRVVDNE